MRMVPTFEKKQRGCVYCLHMNMEKFGSEKRTACPFEECLYRVLDKYKSYEEFMESEESKILVNEFFSTVANIYECGGYHTTNRTFSDGDQRVGF